MSELEDLKKMNELLENKLEYLRESNAKILTDKLKIERYCNNIRTIISEIKSIC